MADRHYDFCGWATKNDVRCADGRTIRKGAFSDCDGKVVPLVYNHSHSKIDDVLGHTLLEEKPEGMYCYGWFNETKSGKNAKASVLNGDINALSIYANHLKQSAGDVMHGNICEVSLVLAGANPEAVIDACFAHGDFSEDEAILLMEDRQEIELYHADEKPADKEEKEKENKDMAEAAESKEKTLQEIFDTMNEDQKKCTYAMIGLAVEQAKGEKDDEGEEEMKHSVFENGYNGGQDEDEVLSHSDEEAIVAMAKRSNVGSLQQAIGMYEEEHNATLAHSFDPSSIGYLYDEFKTIPSGEPNTVTRDQEWVADVLTGINKVPNTRLRTRHVDARTMAFAKGYVTGTEKQKMAALAVTKRETTPQTVYVKDELNKDDIDDINDFDAVNYQYKLLKADLNETLAMAILVGDQRDDDDPQKIEETHIRPIWKDSNLYTIRGEIDMAAAKAAVQGTGTAVNFGDNFVFSEAMIEKSLELRRSYHGVGNLTFYCPTTVLNTMLLAKDRNGRRIYNNATDLASALNVKKIVPIEQFENLTRTVTVSGVEKTKKLIGIMVNLSDYEMGAVKNGQIAKFDQFDIDYNKQKTLLETRASGTLTKLFSAIVIEEDVTSNG